MYKRCICEICSCGRHRCPHNVKKTSGPCTLSEYKNVYNAKPIPERVSYKPQHAPPQGGEFLDATTNRDDYKKMPLSKPFVHKAEEYKAPQGEMDTRTSYMAEYTGQPGQRTLPIKHEGQRLVNAKFEGAPTYRDDYRKWDTQRTQPIYNQQAWAPPTDAFQGQSTTQRDFVPNEIQKRISFKPPNAAQISDAPFPNSTANRDAYVPHALEKRYVREQEKYKPPTSKLDGMTTTRRDYQGAVGGPSQSFKPLGRPFQSEARFEGQTTAGDDYRKWPLERPYVHPHDVYKKPVGDMDTTTNYQATYKELPLSRVPAIRPSSAKKESAQFDGTTNYHQDFRGLMGERAVPLKAAPYVPNPAQFQGQSTYQGEFHKYSQPPPASFRPSQAPINSGKFEDGTSYRTDFIPKAIPICEAALLDQAKSRYRFAGLNTEGHKEYVQTSITPLQSRNSPMQHNRGPMPIGVA